MPTHSLIYSLSDLLIINSSLLRDGSASMTLCLQEQLNSPIRDSDPVAAFDYIIVDQPDSNKHHPAARTDSDSCFDKKEEISNKHNSNSNNDSSSNNNRNSNNNDKSSSNNNNNACYDNMNNTENLNETKGNSNSSHSNSDDSSNQSTPELRIHGAENTKAQIASDVGLRKSRSAVPTTLLLDPIRRPSSCPFDLSQCDKKENNKSLEDGDEVKLRSSSTRPRRPNRKRTLRHNHSCTEEWRPFQHIKVWDDFDTRNKQVTHTILLY